jgi:hypothetical protein
MRNGESCVKERVRVCAMGLAIVIGGGLGDGLTLGQTNGDGEDDGTTLRGKVVNALTKAPLGRALVTTGNDYATLTDDRGQFEIKLPPQIRRTSSAGNEMSGGGIVAIDAVFPRGKYKRGNPDFCRRRGIPHRNVSVPDNMK